MRQVWATYSVSDHLAPKAFVADVMLYDGLVIPVPADKDMERWIRHGWDADLQRRLLKILGGRAKTVPWSDELRSAWHERLEQAKKVGTLTSRDAMNMTANELLKQAPPGTTAVTAVATYHSMTELRTDLNLQENQMGPIPGALVGPGTVAAVIGRELMVPNDPRKDHETLLAQAVELSNSDRFRRKRASYWRWQEDFLNRTVVHDQLALREAVVEMKELIAEEKAEILKSRCRLGVSFAFAIGAVATGMAAAPLAPVAVAGAFLSVGAWVFDHFPALSGSGEGQPGPAAMCLSAQRDFGWKPRR
jgi:hypothetical protein